MSYFHNKKLQRFVDAAAVVIFDMNGFIVDDEGLQLEAWRAQLAAHSVSMTDEEWKTYVGKNSYAILKELEEKHHIAFDADRLLANKNHHYDRLIRAQAEDVVRPGVLEFLTWLHANKRRVAVVTGASRQEVESILGSLSILEDFEQIIDSHAVEHRKPAPDIYLHAANVMNVKPEECVAFEDSGPGVVSAATAGMPVIACTNSWTEEHNISQATLRIDSVEKSATILP